MLAHCLPPEDPNACFLLQKLHEMCRHRLQEGDLSLALVMQASCKGA